MRFLTIMIEYVCCSNMASNKDSAIALTQVPMDTDSAIATTLLRGHQVHLRRASDSGAQASEQSHSASDAQTAEPSTSEEGA